MKAKIFFAVAFSLIIVGAAFYEIGATNAPRINDEIPSWVRDNLPPCIPNQPASHCFVIIPSLNVSTTTINQSKPLAVILDFGSNNFINYSFYERFIHALSNASQLHPKVLIIRIDSPGGEGYPTPEGTLWMPQSLGEYLQFYCKVANVTCYWYVPTLCKSGCFIASSYADHINTGLNGSWYWGHTRGEIGNQTWDWAAGILSRNSNASTTYINFIMSTPARAPYTWHPITWSDFLNQFSNYEIKVIEA